MRVYIYRKERTLSTTERGFDICILFYLNVYVYAVESVIGIIYLFIYAAGARRGCGEGGDGIVNRFACALFLGGDV